MKPNQFDNYLHKTPSYIIIYEYLKKNILKDHFKINDKLPSETELENIFSVSKTPVRQALKQLENDGYIYRQQGKGSFVSNYASKEKWIHMTGFKMEYIQEWEKITAQTLEVKYIESNIIAQALGLQKDTKLIFLTRIRYLNKKPIFFMEHYISPAVPISIFKEDKEFTSIQQVLSNQINIELTTVDEFIEAVNSDGIIAKHLNLPKGTSVLKGSRISYDSNNMPINVDIFYTNTNKWKYFSTYRY